MVSRTNRVPNTRGARLGLLQHPQCTKATNSTEILDDRDFWNGVVGAYTVRVVASPVASGPGSATEDPRPPGAGVSTTDAPGSAGSLAGRTRDASRGSGETGAFIRPYTGGQGALDVSTGEDEQNATQKTEVKMEGQRKRQPKRANARTVIPKRQRGRGGTRRTAVQDRRQVEDADRRKRMGGYRRESYMAPDR